MISDEDRSNSIDDPTLDRLIDGELGESERRELLIRLENDPEGWRRCALAFLEDQAWRAALGGVASRSIQPAPVPMPSRRRSSLVRRLAMAATVIASTFAAGFGAGGLAKGPSRAVAQSNIPSAVEQGKKPGGDQVQELGWINLVDGTAGESPPRRVPILSGPGLDERWLREQPPSVSDYDRAQYERQGYQVEERRRLVSVVLEDGRRVSIPVDEVQLEYVGQQPL